MFRNLEEVKTVRLEFEKLIEQINEAIKRKAIEIKDDRIRVIDWSKI